MASKQLFSHLSFVLLLAIFLASASFAATIKADLKVGPPANNTFTNVALRSFTFNFSSGNATLNCSLWVNNAVVNNSTVSNNANATLNYMLPSNGSFAWYVNCSNLTVPTDFNVSAIMNITLDQIPPNITRYGVNEPDLFYSIWPGNDVINLNISANGTLSNISLITLNLTIHLNGTNVLLQDMTFNNTSGYGNLSFNVTNIITNALADGTLHAGNSTVNTSAVLALDPSFFLTDAAGNSITISFAGPGMSLLPHDIGRFQGPPSQFSSCVRQGALATNISQITNMGNTSFVMEMQINGSANCTNITRGVYQQMPWGDSFKSMGYINFSSVNMNTEAGAGRVMSAMGNLVQMQIAPPRSFRHSRIYINSTAVTELNTNATIVLYDLPFSSTPGIIGDAGTGSVTVNWSQGVYNITYNAMLGNLTITVNGFSGYNVTDNTSPAITFNYPAANLYNTTATTMPLNVTVNGTGSEISALSINLTLAGATVSYTQYSNLTNTANCTQLSAGSEIVTCNLTYSGLDTGYYTINVTAYDYGNNSGNYGSSTRNFTIVGSTPPTVTLNSPLNGGATNATNVTFNWTASDALLSSNLTCNLTIDNIVNRSNVSVANGTAYVTYATSNLSAGTTHTWSVNCSNYFNYSGISQTNNFTVDTTAPGPSAPATWGISPVNNTEYVYGRKFEFNINWTDAGGAGIDTVWLTFNNVNITSNASSAGGVYYFNLTNPAGLAVANYPLNFSANDTAGNRNTTPSIMYGVTKATPSTSNMNVTSSAGLTIAYLTPTTLTGNCPLGYNNTNNSTSLCKLGINGLQIPLTSNLTYLNYSVGTYNLTLNVSAGENYTAGVINYSFVITQDTMPFHLYIDGAETNKTVVNGTSVNVTGTRGYPQGMIKIYMNGSTLVAQNITVSALNATNISNYNIAGVYTFVLNYTNTAGTQNLIAANITLVLTVIANSSVNENQTIANNATVNVTGNTTQIIVPSGSPLQNVTIDPSVADNTTVSLNLSLIAASNGTVDVPNNLTLSRGTYILEIFNGTTVSNSSSWNGTLDLPTVQLNGSVAIPTPSGYDAPVTVSVIEIGSSAVSLTLDHAAQIKFTGQTGNRVGFTAPGGSFNEISTACTANNQAAGDMLAPGTDCHYDDGVDLYVWTKHFTLFATYTQAATAAAAGSTSYSGGGSPGSTFASYSTSTSGTINLSFAGGKVCQMQVDRDFSRSTNLTVMTMTITNLGDSGCDLADLSLSDQIPAEFATVSEITFDPAYASTDGSSVTFTFPALSGGESRVLTYTVHRYMQSAKFAGFTLPSTTAQLASAQAPAPVQNVTPTPTPAPNPNEVGTGQQAGKPAPVPTPAQQAPTAAPAAQGGWQLGDLVAGGAGVIVLILAIAIIAGVAYFFTRKAKKKG